MASILLVEDEPFVAELVEEALSDAGLQVKVARDHRSAVAVLEGDARSFAAVVTDINLGPGATGFEVARKARELNAGIKVVYITGHAAHLARQGVEDALMFPKPFDALELAQRVRRLLDS
ncbi:response regulator [Phenylobacterium sp.]|jgi:CheY-like chemotaxis protein|uniref:response regulator n=1 Tax=Phenylobacterium sp. TaxID=1871053 RepID=UPI002F92491D